MDGVIQGRGEEHGLDAWLGAMAEGQRATGTRAYGVLGIGRASVLFLEQKKFVDR